MNRVTTRISRGLIAGLTIILVVGLVAVLHNSNKLKAAAPHPTLALDAKAELTDPAKTTEAPQPAPLQSTTPQTPTTLPLVSSTPLYAMSNPATAPTGDSPATPSAPATPAAPADPVPLSASSPITSTSNALAQGRAKIDGNELLAGRDILNAALLANQFNDADAAAAKQLMAKANQEIVFSPRRYPDDPNQIAYTVLPGDKPTRIAAVNDITWDLIGRINNISDARKLRSGATIKIIKGPFHAVVTKSKFTLDLYLGSPGEKGSVYIETLNVGLGKDDSTPTGIWMIKDKLKHPNYYSPRGGGIIAADDPQNPLGPCWIGLAGTDGQAVGKESYGIHGTIDPNSIGKQSSMGCIRLHNDDALLVYDLLVDGKSTVIVKD